MGRRIRCKLCSEIIESKHPHYFVRCKCGAVAIDGGDDYTRLLAKQENWEFVDDGPVPEKRIARVPSSKPDNLEQLLAEIALCHTCLSVRLTHQDGFML